MAVNAPPPPLPPGQRYCAACALIIDARAEICPRCGVRQAAPAKKPDGIVWGIVLFLFFFGIVLAIAVCR